MAEQRNPQARGETRRASGTSPEERRHQRSETRKSQTYKHFLEYLRDVGKFPSDEEAEVAAVSVLCTLEQRILGEEAQDMEAQLPARLRELLSRCDRHASGPPPDKFGRDEMLQRVSEDCGVQPEHAEPLVRAVFSALQAQISEGELQQVAEQLPEDLRDLWARPA